MNLFCALLLAAALLLCLSPAASAQTTTPAKPLCDDAKTQREMNQCFAAAFEAADKALNTYYESLSNKLDSASLTKLQAAQQACCATGTPIAMRTLRSMTADRSSLRFFPVAWNEQREHEPLS